MRYAGYHCEECDTHFAVEEKDGRFRITTCPECGSNKSTYGTGEMIKGDGA